jgi:hypothetical protein
MRGVSGTGWRGHDVAGPVWVAVAARRNVQEREDYRVRWLARYEEQVLDHTHPPRMRFEEACLDLVVEAGSSLDRVQLLAAACQSRRTTAERLLGALSARSRVRDRRWIEAVLRDVAAGTTSVLEHGYLTRVERPHGLPRGVWQLAGRGPRGTVYRDVAYPGLGQYVELDGALFHDSPRARDADLERDLDAALTLQARLWDRRP